MTNADPYYQGSLLEGETQISVSVRYATRYSAWLRFNGRAPREFHERYESLQLVVDGKDIRTGPCTIFADEEAAEGEFRLVPLRGVHDFERLFFRGRVETLESAALNLPLVLAYKDRIDPDFLTFVAELTYDLSAYRSMFDDIDEAIADEPQTVRRTISRAILESVGEELLSYLDRQHERLKRITKPLVDAQAEHHGYYFRKQLWNFILSAPIMARTNLKPRGYIGDSEMMRMIYANDFQGDTSFGKILHRHAVGQPAADAVRNRRQDLARVLREFMAAADARNEARIKVLSVACGPAMEIMDIVQSAEECSRLHYSFLDQDRHALLEAGSVVEAVEQRVGAELSTDFIKESVRTMLVTRELRSRWGRFDFIYSMGLFDYLTRPVAEAVLKKLYDLLLPGGAMMIGNFSTESPTTTFMAYWMDWTIIYRTPEELEQLARVLPGAKTRVQTDATGIQLMLRIEKPESDE